MTFDANVTVTGMPAIGIGVGATSSPDLDAIFAAGSGTRQLAFHYTVEEGNTDTDGVSISANSFLLRSGTIRGATGTNANLVATPGLPNQSGHRVDGIRPVLDSALDSATVDGDVLVLTYNEALDDISTPANDAYTVEVDSSAGPAVTGVTISGMTVTLTLATAVTGGQEVALDYIPPGTNPVQDAVGNDALALMLDEQTVMNNTPGVEPSISIAADTSPVTEGTAATFTLTATPAPAGNLTVTVTVTDSGNFIAGAAPTTVTIAASATEATLTVATTGDEVDEANGMITAMVTSGAGYMVDGTNNTAIVMVEDDDDAGVTVTPATLSVPENGSSTADYTLVLNTAPTADVTIAVASDTVTAATVSSASLTFTPTNWDTAQTVTVTGVNDDVDNPSDERTASLSHTAASADGNYEGVAITIASVIVTVDDDDDAGVTVDPLALTVDEAGSNTTADYTLVLDTMPTADVTIAVASDTDTAATVSSASLTFTPTNWNTAQTVTVTGVNDNIDNPSDERTATVNHTAASTDGNYEGVAISIASVTVTVEDDDDPVSGTVTVGLDADIAGDDIVNIAERAAGFAISGTVADGGTVEVTLDGSTTTRAATETGTIWTLDIPANDPEITDTSVVVEATATLLGATGTVSRMIDVDLVAPTATYAAPGTLTVGTPIIDIMPGGASADIVSYAVQSGDIPPGLTLATDTGAISGIPTAANVSTAPVTIRLTDGAGNTEDVTITFPAVGIGSQVLDGFAYSAGTATVGQPAPTVTAPSGAQTPLTYSSSTSAVCTVDTDTGALTLVGAGDCTITVTASATANYNEATADFTITVAAAAAAGVTVTPVTLSVPEAGGTTADYTLVLTSAPTADVTIAVASDTVTAATVSSASLTFTPANWNTAQTVTVTGVNDDVDNPSDERTATVTHAPTSADAGYGSVVIASVTVTITDDDDAGVTVDPLALTVDEAGSGTTADYTVVLDTAPTANVTIAVASDTDTAATVSSASLTFTPTDWDTAQTVTVTGVNDDVPGDRTATVSHTAASGDGNYEGVAISIASVTVTVEDDDAVAPSATLAAADPTTLGARRLNSSTNRATVTVTLMNTVYEPSADLTAADFTPGDTVDGEVTVESVSRNSDTEATLALAHTGSISSDGTVSVTVLDSAHTGSGDLDAGSLPVDATAPTVSSVAFSTTGPYGLGDNIEVTITFSEDVFVEGTTPNANLDNIGGRFRVATPYFSGNGSNTLVFRYTVVPNDDSASGVNIRGVTLLSGGGIIRDAAGNDVVRLNTNNQITGGITQRVDATLPMLSTATVDGTALTLTYDEALDDTSTPANGDYTVTVDTAPRDVSGVAISGMTVTLTLASAVTGGQTVILNYTPGANPVQDTAGNDAAALSNRGVSTTGGTVSVTLGTIAGDNVVNIAEQAAGFAISGTVADGGTVEVTFAGGTPRGTTETGTTWTLDIPANDPEITGTSVVVEATAMLAGASGTVTRPLTVDLAAPTATYAPPPALTVGTAITAIMPGSPSGDIANYAVQSGDIPPGLTLASVTGIISGTPTTANAATAPVTIRLTDTASNPGDVPITFPMVAIGSQTLSGFAYDPATVALNAPTPPTVTPPTGAQTPLTYSSSTSAVCTVDADTGALMLVAAGDCVITVTASATANYSEATADFTITVESALLASAALAGALTEATLNGAMVTVTLTSTEYVDAVSLNAADFVLSEDVPGDVTVTNVGRTSDVIATLTLGHSGEDITTNGTLMVTVQAAAHEGSGNLTTGTVPITALNSDASLADLVVSGGSVSDFPLTPEFTASTTDYTLDVPFSVATVMATPTAAGAGATIDVNGVPVDSGNDSEAIPVPGDSSATVTIEVAAEDRIRTQTYTVQVNRAAGSSNSRLSDLRLIVNDTSQSPFNFGFDPATTAYDFVGAGFTALMVEPTAADAGATITVNGDPVNSGAPSRTLTVTAVGSTATFTIVVTAEDGVARTTYTLDFTRVALFPRLEAATVNGDTLTLDYHIALDEASTPANADYTVEVNGVEVMVTDVTINGDIVTLMLETAVTEGEGQTVTLDYRPGSNPVQSPATSLQSPESALALMDQAVINQTLPPAVAPVFVRAEATATAPGDFGQLILIFDAPLHVNDESRPSRDDFVVRRGGATGTVLPLSEFASVALENDSVTNVGSVGLLFIGAVLGDYTVSYTPSGTTRLRGQAPGDPNAPGAEVAALVNMAINATGPDVPLGVSTVAISSTGPYGVDGVIEVTVIFSEVVTVDTAGGTPQIPLMVGANTRQAVYTSGSTTAALVFTYTVVAGETDADGVSIVEDTLSGNGGTIQNAGGTDAVLVHLAVAPDTAHAVDTSIVASPSITIAADTSPVTEGTAAAFTLTASPPAPVGGLTVTVSVSQTGTFIEGVAPTTVTIAAAATTAPLTVPTTDDDIDEADGEVTATVTAGAGYTVGTGDTASVTVNDDDTAGVTVAPTMLTVDEAGSNTTADYTLVLNTVPTADVTIAVASDTVTAATVSSASLTFTPTNWNTAQTVTVTGVNDDVPGDRTATVTHTATSGDTDYEGAAISIASVTVTVTDDDAVAEAGVTVDPMALTVAEAGSGTTADYTLVLNTMPTGDVTITVANSDTLAATVSSETLTFTTTNWNTAQTVTVTGVNDNVNNPSDERTATLSHTATSGDVAYEGAAITIASVTVTVTDDDDAGVTVDPMALTVDEAGSGATADYTVVLNTVPTADVTIAVVSDTDTAATVSSASLTFTPTNWNTAQTVTVTGVNDDVPGDRTATVSHTATSGDTDYEGAAISIASVTVTVTDDDAVAEAGVTVDPMALTVAEAGSGTTADYTLVLNTMPTGDVTITVANSDTLAATVSSETLTFTTTNWNTAQTVTVTGVNDNVNNPSDERTATLSHTATSGDVAYEGAAITIASVAVTVTDDDDAGVTVDPMALTVDEAGSNTTADYTVVLDTMPTADVTIAVASDTDTAATVSSASLTFTPTDWDTAQTVTVTGVNDDVPGDRTATVTHTAASTDGNYEGVAISIASVTVTVTDDDTANFNFAETDGGTMVAELGGTDTYTVELATEPTHEVTIAVVSGDRFLVTVSSPSLTFTTANWNTAQTVTVTGVNDDVDFGSTFPITVTHTAASTDGNYEGLSRDVVVTVTDDDTAGVTVSETTRTVAEDGGMDTYTVVLNTQPNDNVTITPASSDPDVAIVSAALTFTSTTWDTPQTFTVTGVDDSDVNTPDRTATVSHTSASGDSPYQGLTTILSVLVTATDDDAAAAAGVTVTPTAFSVPEDGGTTADYTLVLDTAPTANVTIAVASDTDTAATVSSASLTFTPTDWDTAQTVTVTGVNDDVPGDRTATVSHTAASTDGNYEGVAISIASVTVTVTDDDAVAAGVTVTPETLSVPEDGGTTVDYTLVLDTAPTADVTIAVASDTVTAATVSSASLTFTPANWNTAQTVTVTGVNDDVDNPSDERTASLSHTATSTDGDYEGVAITIASVTVTVTDDDDAGVTVDPLAFTVDEAGSDTTADYTVVLDTAPTDDVTIAVASDTDTAATVSSASLTFTTTNWNTAQTVTVTGVNDDVPGDRTATVTHTAASTDGNYEGVAISIASVTVTVTDDDAVAEAGVTVDPMALTVAEAGSGTTADYTLVLNTMPTGDVTITVANSDTLAATVSSTSLTFTPTNWDTAQTVTVTGVNDNVNNPSDERTATLSHAATSADGAYEGAAITIASVTVTVTDDDDAGVTVAPTMLTVDEAGSGTTADYTVVLDTAPTADVTIAVASDTDTAATVSSATLTFTPTDWDTAQTVTVTGVNDDVPGDRTATVTHTAASTDGNYEGVAISIASVTVTVNDDDAAAAGVTVTPETLSVPEDGGTADYTLVLDTAPTADVTIAVASDTTSAATVSSASLTFTTTNWNTAQTVTVTGVDDSDVNTPDRTATVTHVPTSTDAGYGSVSIAPVAVTVVDDDAAASVTVTPETLSVPEDGGTADYTLVLDTMPTADVTIAVESDTTSAATVSSASLTFTTTNWNTAQTVTVTGVDDSDVNTPDRTATVTHVPTSTDAGYGSVSIAPVAVTVVDDDAAAASVTVTPETLSVPEDGGTADYTLVLDTAPTADVTIAVASDTTSAATVSSASLTFTTTNWNTAQTVTVTGVDDSDVNTPDRTATVTHVPTSTDAGYGSVSIAPVAVTVVDDDAAASVTVTPETLSVPEDGGTADYTLVLDTMPTADVTIAVESDTTSAATVSSASLTFTTTNWNTAQTVTVTGVDDSDVNTPDRTATVTHVPTSTDAGYGSVSIAPVAVTVVDDDAAAASVTVTPETLSVPEDGGTADYTLVLDTAPTADVTIAVESSSTPVATVSSASLTFTTTNWNTAQTVTVTGVDDSDVNTPDRTATVTHVPTSTDAGYGSVIIPSVEVTATDDDGAPVVGPTVSGVEITTTGTPYGVDGVIDVTVTFSEAVTVSGIPEIALTVGMDTRQATYISGTGTAALVFTYTVVLGDSDMDGVSIDADALAQAGGSTIQDSAGNDAVLDHDPVDAALDQRVDDGMMSGPSARVIAPVPLTESNLNGATLEVRLTGTEYVGETDLDEGDFTLSQTGVTEVTVIVISVIRDSTTRATLVLEYDETPIDVDDSMLGVMVLADGHTGSDNLDAGAVPITNEDPSSDATLANLVVLDGNDDERALTPDFDGSMPATTYAVMVESTVSSRVTVTPIMNHRRATFTVDTRDVTSGFRPAVDLTETIRLNSGDPLTFTINVMAEDASTETYTVVITRLQQTAVFEGASVNGANLMLEFSGRGLSRSSSTPSTQDFTVRVNSAEVVVESVTITDDRVVTLVLETAVTLGQMVTLSYTPGTSPLLSSGGDPAIQLVPGGSPVTTLTDEMVTNATLGPAVAPMLRLGGATVGHFNNDNTSPFGTFQLVFDLPIVGGTNQNFFTITRTSDGMGGFTVLGVTHTGAGTLTVDFGFGLGYIPGVQYSITYTPPSDPANNPLAGQNPDNALEADTDALVEGFTAMAQ